MMRKNFTLLGGAFLVAALGLGSLAYAEEVTEPGTEVVDPDDPAQYEDPYTRGELPATDEENKIKHVFYSMTFSPAAGSTFLTTDKLQSIAVNYSVPGDDVTTLNPNAADIAVFKNDEPLYLIPAANCYIEKGYAGKVIIPLGEVLGAGEYRVIVPNNLVSEVSYADGTYMRYYHAGADNVTFTIVDAVPVEVSLADGEVGPSKLKTLTLTYPEGTVVALAEGVSQLSLMQHNEAGVAEETSTNLIYDWELAKYNVSVNGNVVTLTLPEGATVPGTSKRADIEWAWLNLPSGTFTLNGDPNPAMKLGKWTVRTFDVSAFRITGAENVMATADLSTVVVTSLEPLAYAAGKSETSTSMASLYLSGAATQVGNYKLSAISEDGCTLTYSLQAATSKTSIVGNNDKWISGAYNFRLNANTIALASDANQKNIQLELPIANVKGNEKVVLLNTSPSTNAVTAATTKVLKFTLAYKGVVANADAEITVTCDGEPFATVAAGTTTTAGAKVGAAGSTNVEYALPAFATAGKYTVNVPAGAFQDAANPEWVNEAFSFSFFNNSEIAALVPEQSVAAVLMPASGTVALTAAQCESLTGTERLVLTFPEGYTVSPALPTLTGVNDPVFGFNKFTSVKTAKSSAITDDEVTGHFEFDGNKATFVFDRPMNKKYSDVYACALVVPANAFAVAAPGKEAMPCGAYNFWYKAHTFVPGSFNLDAEQVNAAALAEFEYTANQTCYFVSAGTVAKAELKDDEGNVVTTYTITTPAEGIPTDKCPFTADNKSVLAELPAGLYTLEVPANVFWMGNPSTTSDRFFKNEAFSKVLNVVNGEINTGVNSAAVDSQVTVVAIDGRVLLRNADRSALSTLRPGIYVVNGKKTVVR